VIYALTLAALSVVDSSTATQTFTPGAPTTVFTITDFTYTAKSEVRAYTTTILVRIREPRRRDRIHAHDAYRFARWRANPRRPRHHYGHNTDRVPVGSADSRSKLQVPGQVESMGAGARHG
jgi:hypothetical protein